MAIKYKATDPATVRQEDRPAQIQRVKEEYEQAKTAGTAAGAKTSAASGSPLNRDVRDAQVRQAWASRPATERFAPATSATGPAKAVPRPTTVQRLNALSNRIGQREQQLTNMGLQLNQLETAYNAGDYSAVDKYNALANQYNTVFNQYVADVDSYNKLYRGEYRDQGIRNNYARSQYGQAVKEARQATRDQGSRQLYQQRQMEEKLRAPQLTTLGKENEQVVERTPNRVERVIGGALSGTAGGLTTTAGLAARNMALHDNEETTLRRKGASVGAHSQRRINGEGPVNAGFTFTPAPTATQERVRAKTLDWAEDLIDTGRNMNTRSGMQADIAKEGLGTFGSFLVDASIAGIQMAADIGMSVVTGGSMLVPMFIRSLGSGYLSAEEMGYSGREAEMYGLGVAAVEVLTERISSVFGIAQRFAKGAVTQEMSQRVIDGVVKRLASSPGGQTALNRLFTILFSAGSEGLEEVIAGVMEPLIRKMALDNDLKAWKEVDWQEALYEGLIGGLLGGIGGAVDLTNTRPTYRKYYNQGIDDGIDNYVATAKKYGIDSKEAMDAAKAVWDGGNKKMNAVAGFIVGANENGEGGTYIPIHKATTEDLEKGLPVTYHQLAAAEEVVRYGRTDAKTGEQIQGPSLTSSLHLGRYLQQEENARREAARKTQDEIQRREKARRQEDKALLEGVNPAQAIGAAPAVTPAEQTSRGVTPNEDGTVRLDTASSARAAERASLPTANVAAAGGTSQGAADLSGIPESELTQEEKDELAYGSGAVEDLGQYTGLAQRMGAPINKGGINNDRISDGSSQRDAGERGREGSGRLGKTAAGSEGGPVSAESGNHEGTDQSHGAIQKVTDDDSQSTKIQRRLQNAANLEMTSGRMYSIGSTDDRALMAEMTDEMTAADQELSRIKDFLERRGFEVHFFKGWIGTERGSKARGSHEDGVIWIKVDDPDWTATQIALHEYMHGRIWQSDRRLFSRLFEKLRDPKYASRLNEISSRYQEALTLREGSDVDKAEHILEEMMCDLYAGMNEFAAETDNAKSLRADVWADVESLDAKGTRENRAPPQEGETTFSEADEEEARIQDAEQQQDLQTTIRQLTEQVARLTDRLEGKESEAAVAETRFSEVEDTVPKKIARSDIDVLRRIGRKSVNTFNSDDISNSSKWASLYWRDLKEKSPFFRAWFGDWRAYDKSPVTVSDIPRFTSIKDAARSQRGASKNRDTGWDIVISDNGQHSTIAHAGAEHKSIYGLAGIKDLVSNAVLLDSETHEPHGKHPENDAIAFDHKLYALGRNYLGEIGLYRITVEDMFQDTKHPSDKRFHNLKYIEKVADVPMDALTGKTRSDGSTMGSPTTNYSVADIYRLVKTYDHEFTPAPEVSRDLLEDDGTPKKVYHQTAEEFWTFDNSNPAAGKYDSETPNGFFFKDNDHDIGIGGDRQMECYLRMLNPLHFADRKEANAWYCQHVDGYAARQKEMEAALKPFEDRLSAIEKQMFAADTTDEKYNQLDEEWNGVLEEMREAENEHRGELRSLLDDYFLGSGSEYDGIILDYDGHRYVDGKREDVKTYIVFEKGQAKSATDNIGTFDKAKGNTRFSEVEDLEEAGITYDAETGSVAPTGTSFSEKTWSNSEYVRGRNAAAKELAQAMGISEKKARKYIDDINSVAKLIVDDRERLDYIAAAGLSPFVSNAEYGGSFDFSTLCKKRRLFTGTFSAIQERLPNTALSPMDILRLRAMMKDAGLEVPCGLCYVEGSRAGMGKFSQEFIKLYKKYHPEAGWFPAMTDVNTPDGVELMRQEHPEAYAEYERFWNNYGRLSKDDPALFASQQKPKLYMARSAYDGEVLRYFKKKADIIEKNLNGGLRLQSFSDFEIANMIDVMQVIMDMSRVGLAGQAYTKVPEFALAFGGTGLKINLSLITKGLDENGQLIFDDVEGMPIDTALRIRDMYSKNVGTILVVFNEEQLKAAMADDRIDFIIPFHKSQWNKGQYDALGLPEGTMDFTDQQNEKWFVPRYHDYKGRQVKTKLEPIMSNTYWEFDKDGKYNAEKYLRMCAEDGRRPVFYKQLVDNHDGSYSLQPDGSTDGYWKLLIDFKMYDNEGNGAPQLPVRPDFSMDEITRIMNEYEGGHEHFPVAHGIVDQFVKEYKQEHKGAKFSEAEDLDEQYMAAVESGDMDTAQRMVDEAAAAAGFSIKVSHGTPQSMQSASRGPVSGADYKALSTNYADKLFPFTVFRPFSGLGSGVYTATNRGVSEVFSFNFSENGTVFDLYARSKNPLVIDAGGSSWMNIPRESIPAEIYEEIREKYESGIKNIDFIASVAKRKGYDAVIAQNIHETGLGAEDDPITTDVIVFSSDQLKSADPVTYDDDGKVIPLSERFRTDRTGEEAWKNDDIRFSEVEEDGTEAETPKELESMEPSERAKELIAAAAHAKQVQKQTQKILRSLRLAPKENALANDILDGTLTVNEMRRGSYDQPVDKGKVERAYEAKRAAREAQAPVDEYNKRRRADLDSNVEALTENSDEWKDHKNMFAYARETARRNFYGLTKDAAEAEAMIGYFIDPIREHEAAKNRMVSRYNDRIKKLGIETRKRKGNKVSEAYAIQFIGELEFIRDWLESLPEGETRDGVTYQEAMTMLSEFWSENPNFDKDRIYAAVAEFRSIYDEIFAMVNEARVLNGYTPIDYRKGYFPHFSSNNADNIIQSLANGMGIGVEVTELPTSIAGTTHLFRPGIQWSGHMQRRIGNETDYNVLEGWDRYIPAVANIIYHTEDIQKLRALERVLRQKYNPKTVSDEIDSTHRSAEMTAEEKYEALDKLFNRDTTQLNYFVQWVREYTNQLAGKRAETDRNAEKNIGRTIYSKIQKIENKVAANMLGGNISSAMTNFVPLFQAWANVRSASMMRAMWDTGVAAIRRDGFRDGSSFLVNRRGYDAMYQTLFGKTKNALFMPFNIIDDFVSETIVRARYYDELRSGASPEAALMAADTFAGSVMADRAIGELPTIFNSKNPIYKVFTMFQVEVNNDISHLIKDIPRDAKKHGMAALFMSLLKYMLGVYMFNDLFEWLFGRRVSLDPLSMLNDIVGDATGYELPNMFESAVLIAKGEWQGWEEFENGKGDNFLSDLIKDAKNWADDLPFISGILNGGRYPIRNILPEKGSFDPAWEALQDILKGEDRENPKEYDLSKMYKFAKNPLWYGVMPAFGGQMRKIAEGIQAYTQHGSYSQTKQGRVLQYPILDYGDLAKAMAFGKTTTRYGKEWVESDFDSLTVPQTEAYITLVGGGSDPEMVYQILHDLKGTDRTAVEKAYALATANLDDGERIMLFGALDRDKEAENFADLMLSGLTFRQCADVLDEWTPLKAKADLTAEGDEGKPERTRLATQFAGWLDEEGYTDEQKKVILDNYKLGATPIRYDWLVRDGISNNGALELAMDWSSLSPEAGKDSVSANQKIDVVADAGYLTKNEKHIAVRSLLSDDVRQEDGGSKQTDYDKYVKGYDISVEAFNQYLKVTTGVKGYDRDGDGKTDSGSKRDALFAAINTLPLQAGQKTALALYQGDYSESSIRKNAPWLR